MAAQAAPPKPGASAPPAARIDEPLPPEPSPDLPARVAPPQEQAAPKFPVLPGVGVDIITLCAALARSGYFPNLKSVSQAMVKVLAGQELGIGPIRAMTDIHVVELEQGRTQMALGASLMASLIQRSGRFDYAVIELTDEACEIAFYEFREIVGVKDATESRKRVELGRSRFTMEDAKRAKLAGKANWQQYPRNMHFARAMSNGAKWYCSAVFGGAVYTPEEIRDAAPEAEAPEPLPVPTPAAPAEPVQAQEEKPTAASESPDAGSTAGKTGPAGGAPPGAAAVPPMEPPPPIPGEDPTEARAREMTWRRMVRAMASCGMTEQEMRGIARTFYRADPETMPVDQLALLVGRIETMIGPATGTLHPSDAAKAAAERRAGA